MRDAGASWGEVEMDRLALRALASHRKTTVYLACKGGAEWGCGMEICDIVEYVTPRVTRSLFFDRLQYVVYFCSGTAVGT